MTRLLTSATACCTSRGSAPAPTLRQRRVAGGRQRLGASAPASRQGRRLHHACFTQANTCLGMAILASAKQRCASVDGSKAGPMEASQARCGQQVETGFGGLYLAAGHGAAALTWHPAAARASVHALQWRCTWVNRNNATFGRGCLDFRDGSRLFTNKKTTAAEAHWSTVEQLLPQAFKLPNLSVPSLARLYTTCRLCKPAATALSSPSAPPPHRWAAAPSWQSE